MMEQAYCSFFLYSHPDCTRDEAHAEHQFKYICSWCIIMGWGLYSAHAK